MLETVPTVEFPPCTPFTFQIMGFPLPDALNCLDCPVCTVAAVGEIKIPPAVPVPEPLIIICLIIAELVSIVNVDE